MAPIFLNLGGANINFFLHNSMKFKSASTPSIGFKLEFLFKCVQWTENLLVCLLMRDRKMRGRKGVNGPLQSGLSNEMDQAGAQGPLSAACAHRKGVGQSHRHFWNYVKAHWAAQFDKGGDWLATRREIWPPRALRSQRGHIRRVAPREARPSRVMWR